MTKHPLLDQESWLDPDEDAPDRVQSVLDKLTPEQFKYWYREWQFRENIENGNSYFNKTGYVPDGDRHSPSKLMQCQRKQYYNAFNAPAEEANPTGVFWVGERFEEEIVMPFLSDFAESVNQNNYVQNSMWVDFEIGVESDEDDLDSIHIRGETDPVIVDRRGNPLVVTEVKNKKSLSKFEDEEDPEPDIHHKAQIHAYMYGLSKSFERNINTGLILYGSRSTHELLPITVEFDQEFWEKTVTEWARKQSEYRLNEELPPMDPHFSWECKFCDYAQRCGMTDDAPWQSPGEGAKRPSNPDWHDTGSDGFLPLTEYPLDHVIEYMRAHAPKGAKLTPTLANQYPSLREKFEVFDWVCPDCDAEWPEYQFDWNGNTDGPPSCPDCSADLRGPLPENQH